MRGYDRIMKVLRDLTLDIGAEQVKRYLVQGRGKKLTRRTKGTLLRSLDECTDLMQPAVLYAAKPIVKAADSSVVLKGNILLKGKKLSRAMKKCTEATLFIATVGKKFDMKVKDLMKKKQFSRAYIYDAIGSVAAEETVELFQKEYDEKMERKGKATTLRFSPGYCDWPIEEQKKLFQVLDSTKIDVALSPACLMKPRKSVSGVFGVGIPGEIGKKRSNPCSACARHNCLIRRSE